MTKYNLEYLAKLGQKNYKQMIACISQGQGKEAMLYNRAWLAILDLIRDGKYKKQE